MKTTQLFREQLGLSQEAMAQYLGITKSQISMYELGKRELPTPALARLAAIAVFLEHYKNGANDHKEIFENQEIETIELLELVKKELEYQCIKEQRKLDRIQKKYNENLKLFSFVNYFQNEPSIQMEALLQQALKGIEKNGLAAQTKQILKLTGCIAQLNYINNVKEK